MSNYADLLDDVIEYFEIMKGKGEINRGRAERFLENIYRASGALKAIDKHLSEDKSI